jgi:ABC-type Na+ efflux pump permease subunit
MHWLAAPFGPLAGPEIRRALRAGWLLWARLLLALPALVWLLAACWAWWFASELDQAYRPGRLLTLGLGVTATLKLLLILVLAPSLSCGAMAGRQCRAAGEVLLASPVSAAQIVAARLAGRLCQVAALSAAGLPSLVFFAGACGVAWWRCVAYFLLLAIVAWGSGGLALGLSASTLRARDALLGSALALAIMVLGHRLLAGRLPSSMETWLVAWDPFAASRTLLFGEVWPQVARFMTAWTLLGTTGTAWAAWRLRPAVLGMAYHHSGHSHHSHPALGNQNPVQWKDLYVDRLGSLHRLAARLGTLLSLLLGLAGAAVATAAVYARWLARDPALHDRLIVLADSWQVLLGTPLSLVVQWALGARAALSVAAERERRTWESLLASPLEGQQIVWGKIVASAHALRWLMAAAFIWWTACLCCGALSLYDYLGTVVSTGSGCLLMLALGVWAAISVAEANRAFVLIAAAWLASVAIFKILAWLAGGVASATYVLAVALKHNALTDATGNPVFSPGTAELVFSLTVSVSETVLWLGTARLTLYLCCRFFDRTVGRAPVASHAQSGDGKRRYA